MRQIKYEEAINEALMEEMNLDETVILIGENVSADVLKQHKGLYSKFGRRRVRDTGISEAAIVGAGIGAAIAGYRPIADVMFSDFCAIAFDEIVNKAAKWRFCNSGVQTIPLVIKTSIGGYLGAGAEHSQCFESYIMHTPGLKIAIPSTPYDAKGLLKTAIRDNNPVVYMHHKILLGTMGEVPEEEYTIPFGIADVKKEGKDVTVVATGFMVKMTLDVANQLQEKGVSVEVIDPRTLEPFDIETIVASVKKTKRVVIVDEDTLRCGVTGEIAAQIMEKAFDYLDSPIQRVAAANFPIAGNLFMEEHILPQPQKIADAIKTVLGIKEDLPVRPLQRARRS
jgi:pyruvate/2-oxoglutarate/acetoin dehydrogenase E1 component